MTKVQVKPGLQIETDQLLAGMALLDVAEIERFQGQVSELLAKKNGHTLSEEERERITHANLELPEETRQRHAWLESKQQLQMLTQDEEDQLEQVNQKIESAKNERLKHLRFLTRVKDVPLEKLGEYYQVYLTQNTICLIETELEDNRKRNKAASELLRKWSEEGDPEEQRETWEFLKVALDEDRLSYRKLFP